MSLTSVKVEMRIWRMGSFFSEDFEVKINVLECSSFEGEESKVKLFESGDFVFFICIFILF